jgi:hypothetical protein
VSGPAKLGKDGAPRLARCALLFLDLLGVKKMATGERAQQNLVDLEQAIRSLGLRDFLDPDSAFPAAIFSDTVVMAAPTDLFARGAITLGDF